VLAKVAGVDTAVFGLKDTPAVPLLFDHPRGNLLVATGKLSGFVTGRYMPTEAWRTIWQTILSRLQPGGPAAELTWTPTVHASYGPEEPLPADAERQALRRSAQWILRSRILRHPNWPQKILDRSTGYNTVREMPAADWPLGDGSLGILEGFSSTIRADGSQPMRYAVRNDCTTEVAMLMALDTATGGPTEHGEIAANLLDYIFTTSGLAGGPRADANSPPYGLVGWALDHPGSYWGDDNARALLAVGAVSALLKEPRWAEATVRCILGNLRTTGVYGFRPSCVTEKALEKNGWHGFWTGRHVHYSPHYQAWIWACYLWLYEQTGFEPLVARTKTGMRMMIDAYPDRWNWCLRSGTIERSRLLLPLAWLVRIEDTPEHRRWLRQVAEDLVALQDASGAIREVIGDGGPGIHSNAVFGTRETSLIQTDGDPVCDMLYSCNFALIGLHEAAAATGDPFYAEAEEKLARFLCRIQIRSQEHPELDGAWYRAFNFRRWEYWASNADWEWGPWCTESGWCQPWIAGTLALRQRKTSLWELVQQVDLRKHFDRLRPQMLPDEALAAPESETSARGLCCFDDSPVLVSGFDVELDFVDVAGKHADDDTVDGLDAGKGDLECLAHAAFVEARSARRQDLEAEARLLDLPDHGGHGRRVVLVPGVVRHIEGTNRRHLFHRPRDILPGEEIETRHEEVDLPPFVGDALDAIGIVGRHTGHDAAVMHGLDEVVHLLVLPLAKQLVGYPAVVYQGDRLDTSDRVRNRGDVGVQPEERHIHAAVPGGQHVFGVLVVRELMRRDSRSLASLEKLNLSFRGEVLLHAMRGVRPLIRAPVERVGPGHQPADPVRPKLNRRQRIGRRRRSRFYGRISRVGRPRHLAPQHRHRRCRHAGGRRALDEIPTRDVGSVFLHGSGPF
jgi:hypothetical protein